MKPRGRDEKHSWLGGVLHCKKSRILVKGENKFGVAGAGFMAGRVQVEEEGGSGRWEMWCEDSGRKSTEQRLSRQSRQ